MSAASMSRAISSTVLKVPPKSPRSACCMGSRPPARTDVRMPSAKTSSSASRKRGCSVRSICSRSSSLANSAGAASNAFQSKAWRPSAARCWTDARVDSARRAPSPATSNDWSHCALERPTACIAEERTPALRRSPACRTFRTEMSAGWMA